MTIEDDEPQGLMPEPSLDEAFNEIVSQPDVSMVRFSVEVDDKKYGAALVLPEGFPTRHANERQAVELHAIRLAQLVFETFVRHYYPEDTEGYHVETATDGPIEEPPSRDGGTAQ